MTVSKERTCLRAAIFLVLPYYCFVRNLLSALTHNVVDLARQRTLTDASFTWESFVILT
jgi:hypothetical protein